jgi:hypothetical protein
MVIHPFPRHQTKAESIVLDLLSIQFLIGNCIPFSEQKLAARFALWRMSLIGSGQPTGAVRGPFSNGVDERGIHCSGGTTNCLPRSSLPLPASPLTRPPIFGNSGASGQTFSKSADLPLNKILGCQPSASPRFVALEVPQDVVRDLTVPIRTAQQSHRP